MNAEEREQKSLGLVRKFALASIGVGVFVGPVLDFVALTALLVVMVEKIAGVYERPFYPHLAKSLIAGLLAAAVQHFLAFGVVASLLKFVPVVGWGPLLLVSPAASFALTTAVGALFIMHFESGGTLLDFDVDAMHAEFGRRYRRALAQDNAADASAEKVSDLEVEEPTAAPVCPPPVVEEPIPAEAPGIVVSDQTPPSDPPVADGDDETVDETPAVVTPEEAPETPVLSPPDPVAPDPSPAVVEGTPEPAAAEANLEKKQLVVKAYQEVSYAEICAGPTDAIRGVSDGDAQILREVFAVHTVAEFAAFSWTQVAEKLVAAASAGHGEAGAPYLDAAFATTPIEDVPPLGLTALKGIGDKRAAALDECFRTKTIAKLAQLKFVHMARTLVSRC